MPHQDCGPQELTALLTACAATSATGAWVRLHMLRGLADSRLAELSLFLRDSVCVCI